MERKSLLPGTLPSTAKHGGADADHRSLQLRKIHLLQERNGQSPLAAAVNGRIEGDDVLADLQYGHLAEHCQGSLPHTIHLLCFLKLYLLHSFIYFKTLISATAMSSCHAPLQALTRVLQPRSAMNLSLFWFSD